MATISPYICPYVFPFNCSCISVKLKTRIPDLLMNKLSHFLFKADLGSAEDFLAEGADINSDVDGLPIYAAINSEIPDVLRFCIRHGADVNKNMTIEVNLSTVTCTPLHIAIENAIDAMVQGEQPEPAAEDMEMVRILVEHGADLTLTDSRGHRPLDVFNGYTNKLEQFNLLKDFFRKIIPDIDNQVEFKPRY